MWLQNRLRITLVIFATIAILAAMHIISQRSAPPAEEQPLRPSSFTYVFNVPEILYESDSTEHSSSPYWWLDSGGKMFDNGSYGGTVQGRLAILDHWRLAYAITNPVDTDNGFHPQNIFRLVSKSLWSNVQQEFFFKITADNFSRSKNRNESNGVLLMSRYQDGDTLGRSPTGETLYYAGIRVDGTAVIKKKYQGVYYTMAQQKIFPGHYSRVEDINLLPHDTWLGLRAQTITQRDGTVTIRMYLTDEKGTWHEILSALDDGKRFGNTPIIGEGHIGIRTDFMDVQFQSFHAELI